MREEVVQMYRLPFAIIVAESDQEVHVEWIIGSSEYTKIVAVTILGVAYHPALESILHGLAGQIHLESLAAFVPDHGLVKNQIFWR